MSTKRPKRCSNPGCKAPAKKAGMCGAHYMEGYRSGVRLRQVEDLGPNPARLHALIPRDLERRFHAAVPKDQRSRAVRRALEAELQRMSEEPTDLVSGD